MVCQYWQEFSYRIHKYSLSLIAKSPQDPESEDEWTAKITLLRVEGPASQDLIRAPTPSQVDDFVCFKQIEKRDITKLVGSGAYQLWKASEERKIAQSVPSTISANKVVARAGINVFSKVKPKPFR